MKGESPAKVLLRALYPDGQTCRVKKERRLRQLQGPPAERPNESTHSSEARFRKTDPRVNLSYGLCIRPLSVNPPYPMATITRIG